ncbi:hypothetical protein B0H16DRAFT_1455913 [Mycena metata]|uniref:MYND-type domain-containing protein n=1 Tax=Mycena metata TaxID=1033252 RepID=A0AAD7JED1_9AGAR|nr:hypothetical protein B0H16DRAFT_1455913 [Mycena metata]
MSAWDRYLIAVKELLSHRSHHRHWSTYAPPGAIVLGCSSTYVDIPMQATTGAIPPAFSPHVAPVFKSLLNPLQSPYCHHTFLASMAECTGHFARAHESADPVLQDVVTALITFYAMQMEDPAIYTLLENCLFNRPCRCTTLFPYLRRSFHAAPDAISEVHTRISEGEGEPVVDLPSFIDVLSEFSDRLLSSSMGAHQNPGVRAWRRKISNFLDKNSTALICSFAYWLQKTQKVYTFALFGTLLEMSPKLVAAMEQSGAVRRAFDERFHALVTAEYISDAAAHPARPWSCLDLIFHGAGCMGLVIQRTMSTTSSFSRFRACFEADIQDGTMHDMFRLAHFGAHLYKLLNPASGPLSHLITAILDQAPMAPNGWTLFDTYFSVTNLCSNPARHCVTGESDSPKDFTVGFKLKVKRGDRMPACSNCKASRFCSKICQKDSWKGGKTPHRDVCATLADIFKVHQKSSQETGNPKGIETLYSDAGISAEEVGKAVGYVIHMMKCFSDQRLRDLKQDSGLLRRLYTCCCVSHLNLVALTANVPGGSTKWAARKDESDTVAQEPNSRGRMMERQPVTGAALGGQESALRDGNWAKDREGRGVERIGIGGHAGVPGRADEPASFEGGEIGRKCAYG